jgi:esterase FrsA
MNVPQPLVSNERTINEIKVEALARAERGAYTLIGLDPNDVREALTLIETRDADEWASAWSAVALRHYGVAKESSNAQERRSNYLRA